MKKVKSIHLPKLARSWKTILTLVFTLTFLLFGFRHHEWFKETEFPQKFKQLDAMIAEYSSRLHHYQARFRMPKEQLELLKKESQTLENNFREILSLIDQIGVLKALLRDMRDSSHNYSWTTVGDILEEQDSPEVLDEEMSNLVHYVLKKLREDQVQMADYALKSAELYHLSLSTTSGFSPLCMWYQGIEPGFSYMLGKHSTTSVWDTRN
ncbi:SUN domain-containing protein 3-like isoform 3-T3 [Thomomys bottae]